MPLGFGVAARAPRSLRRTGEERSPFPPGRRPSPEGPEVAKPLSCPGGQQGLVHLSRPPGPAPPSSRWAVSELIGHKFLP